MAVLMAGWGAQAQTPPTSVILSMSVCSTGDSASVTGSSFYSTLGVATSIDYGKTWPANRGASTFSFVPLPQANKTRGPTPPAAPCASSLGGGPTPPPPPPATYGRYPALSPPYPLA